MNDILANANGRGTRNTLRKNLSISEAMENQALKETFLRLIYVASETTNDRINYHKTESIIDRTSATSLLLNLLVRKL